VVSRVPAPDTNGVSLNIVVSVTFSEPVDCATVTAAAFAIQGVTASIACTADNPTVTLTPGADLAATTEYTVTLYSDVADPAGNNLAQDVVWRFTTGTGIDDTPPDPPTADNPAPSSPTFNSTMPVGGWKEPNASVEYRWEVDSTLKQDWTEIAGKTPANSWNHTFDLDLGLNAFSLRSVDPSNNISTTTTDFSIQRDTNPNQVNPPTVDPVTSPHRHPHQRQHGGSGELQKPLGRAGAAVAGGKQLRPGGRGQLVQPERSPGGRLHSIFRPSRGEHQRPTQDRAGGAERLETDRRRVPRGQPRTHHHRRL
jgi:hypothetical protein